MISGEEGLAQTLPPVLGTGAPYPTTPAILRALRVGPKLPKPRLQRHITATAALSAGAHIHGALRP